MAGLFLGLGSWATSAAMGCAASLGFQTCRCAGGAATAVSTRLGYVLLFLCGQVASWVLRDFAKPLLQKLPWVVRYYAGEPPDSWFGEQAVLRVSLGNFLFFSTLAAALAGVETNADARHKHVHKGSWALKTLAWALLNALPFLLPNGVIAAYAWVARLCSGVFLVVQMVILLDFAYAWNESWVARESRRWLAALLGATAGCYGGALALTGLSYRWFKPVGAGDCSLNVFLVTLSLLLGVCYSAAALHPSVTHGSLLCSACIFLYNAYLTLSALSSEPPGYACNGHRAPVGTGAGTAGAASGMVFALLSVAYSAARAGSSGAFTLRQEGDSDSEGDDGEAQGAAAARGHEYQAPLLDAAAGDECGASDEEDRPRTAALKRRRAVRPVAYNYSFFHAIFALASCYTAMLLTDWGSGQGSTKDQIGVGWASVWVKVVSSWLTAALYAWSLAAPLIFPERAFE